MRPTTLILLIAGILTACTAPTLAPTQVIPPTAVPQVPTVAPATAAPLKPTEAPKTNQPLVYLSGTSHIETNRQTWPNPDSFLSFLKQVTSAGLKWSVGADIGWLEGEPRAAELIKAAEALGVEWDIHAHKTDDRPKNVAKIKALGGKPNTVISGLVLTELEEMRAPFKLSDGGSWFGDILWGYTLRADHTDGSEDTSTGLWKPKNSKEFYSHDPNGNLIVVGGGTRDLAGAEAFAKAGSKFAVTSASIMVNPSKLVVIDMKARNGLGTAGLTEIKSFAERVSKLPNVRFATISQTAKAWVEAGSVPNGSQLK